MKNVNRTLALVLAGLMHVSARGAELSSAKGTVEIKRSGAALWMQAKMKDRVSPGDTLRTGAGASAEIHTGSGHAVSLREKTTARVQSDTRNDSRFFLEVGRLRAKVAKLHGGDKFEIRTPLAVASVRGTVFDVQVGEDHTSFLSVIEGKVAYKELAGAGQEVLVPAGEQFTFTPPPAPPASDGGTAPAPRKPGDLKEKDPKDLRREDKERKEKDVLRKKEKEEEELRLKNKEEGNDEKLRKEKEDQDHSEKDEKTDKTITLARAPDVSFKEDVMRETSFTLDKEIVQADVAQDLKIEQAQTGRALIDAFGRRVRFEDYLNRPTSNSFEYLSLSQRDNRLDTLRYDVVARTTLPKDLSLVDLFQGDLSKNWAVSTHLSVDNGSDYYREWRDGGSPMSFTDGIDRAVFSNWYVEVGGEKGATLLSHWIPESGYGQGSLTAANTQASADLRNFGAQAHPTGYVDYFGDVKNLGDAIDRPIDAYAGLTLAERVKGMTKYDSVYAVSEGFDRTVQGFYDGKQLTFGSKALQDKALASTSNFTIESTYRDFKGNTVAVLDASRIVFSDDGTLYPRGKGAPGGLLQDGVNLETVYSSKSFLTGDVDGITSSLATHNGLKNDE